MSSDLEHTEWIDRPDGLRWLQTWRDRDVVKVVTGVRRCGKSTLLRMFSDNLLASGIRPEQIVSVNLEDPQYAHLLGDYTALYAFLRSRIRDNQRTYFFLDEIQQADQCERVIDGLFITEGVDLYVTGSSSRLLSGNLATLLTGRYVELPLMPLSFAEFVHARHPAAAQPLTLPLLDLYGEYVRYGGFPLAVQLPEIDQVTEYLHGIINTVLLRDVAPARRVSNVNQLLNVTEFLFSNIGNLTSPKRIADVLTSAGRSVSRPTIESYLAGLTDAYLIYTAKRWDIRGHRLLEAGEKHYVVDMGMRRAMLGSRPVDAGHVLENIVYLELLRRGGKVYVGKIGSQEVDFIVERQDGTSFMQVSLNVDDPATLERELAPLRAAPGFNERMLLTMDREPPQSYDGIRRISVLDWLLDPRGRVGS